jgi:hypothetical protein
VVGAHRYGWHLHNGPQVRDGYVIAHQCDEPSCHNPGHWELIPGEQNTADYHARRGTGPLADCRGPQHRAEALRDAITSAIAAGASAREIETAIAAAIAAGRPAALTLF